jgi:hypothetical protein
VLLTGALLSWSPGAAVAEIGVEIGHWQDYSRTVDVKVFRCGWVYGQHNTASCTLPYPYAIVGGGAETCSFNPGTARCPESGVRGEPGALLTASYPSDTATWSVGSSDHVVPYAHFLRAYAIGMRLIGLTHPVDLRSEMHIRSSRWPEWGLAYAMVDAGDLLVGGGASTTTGWTGQLLKLSYPVPDFQGQGRGAWFASSGNQTFHTDEQGTVTAYAIGIPRCPNTYNGCITTGMYWWNGPHGGGYQPSTIPQPDEGWATSSIGAYAQQDPASPYIYNRFITAMIPEVGFARGSATVWSKDHVYPQSGWSVAYTLVVARQWW